MRILAFDTSSVACSVALLDGDRISVSHQIAPMQHAQLILSMIDELLVSHSLTLSSLDAISYGVGPGSFTGIRIASSLAQGLAYPSQKPLIPISSLAAIAQTAYEEKRWTNLLVAVDARMARIYWASYAVNEENLVSLQAEEQCCTPEEIIIPEHDQWYGVGDAWSIYREKLNERLPIVPLAIEPSILPNAKAILTLAQYQYKQNNWQSAFDAHPVYLR